MAKNPRIYQKLTSPRTGLAMYSSLWLAADHLMLVRSTGYTEHYQRFQLSDLQAFVIVASHRRRNWAIAWVVLGVIALIPLLVFIRQGETPIFSTGFVGLALLLLAINFFLGPSCSVSVVTRVQTARLPIVRRRKADKILGRLRPLIEAVQAEFATDTAAVPAVPPSFT